MGRSVIERLMWALVVVVIDVAGDFGTGLLDVLEPVEPDAPFLERTDEPLAQHSEQESALSLVRNSEER